MSYSLFLTLHRPAFYDAARGLAGIGAGLMLPTAVALLGQAYPPGRKRNLAFGLFGTFTDLPLLQLF
jgi:MFS family permease